MVGEHAVRLESNVSPGSPVTLTVHYRPEDVAGPVLFLASDWAGFMTGQVLFVDGGLVMR